MLLNDEILLYVNFGVGVIRENLSPRNSGLEEEDSIEGAIRRSLCGIDGPNLRVD